MVLTGRLKFFNAKITSLILFTLWVYAFWPTISSAAQTYLHSGFDYQGYLILPIIILMINNNKSNLKRASASYNPLGLLLLFIFAAITLSATLMELTLLKQIATLSMLLAIVFTIYGTKITSILLIPLSSLFLMLPVGMQLFNLTQQGFTWLLMQALMLTGQSVYWEGNLIIANNHSYDMASYICSMHYMLSFLTLGLCFALFRTKFIVNTIVVAFSFVLMPLIMLWLSLYSYVLLNQWSTTLNIFENHLIACGWILTIIGLLHAVVLGIFIGDKKGTITRHDNIDWRHEYLSYKQQMLEPLIIASCIILILPAITQHLQNKAYEIPPLPSIPNNIANWQSVGELSAKSTGFTKYRKDQDLINLAITHQAQQTESSWVKIKQSTKKIQLTNHNVAINETVFKNEENKYKIDWRVNYVNGYYTSNQTIAKALIHIYNLSTQKIKTGIITISTDANSELSLARDRLRSFLEDFTNCQSTSING